MKLKEGYAELVAEEATLMENRRNRLMNLPQIKPYVNSVAKYVEQTQGRPITMHEKRNVAQCLYNCISESAAKGRNLFETTTEDNISFLGVQLPVIAALIPTLVMNKVAVVQALDRRIGAVFYLDVKYGSTKGEITAGDTMLSSTTGHEESKSGRRYARASVERESLGTGDGTYSGTTDYNPGLINLENCVVEMKVGTTYTTIGTCSAAGVFASVSPYTVSGTITAAGVYSITVSGATSGSTISLTYDYQYDLPKDAYDRRDGVPKVDISVTQSAVEAVDYPLRADWSLGAQIDLQKAHGIDLERELVKYLGSEVKFTIDQEGLDRIDTAAASSSSAGTITQWDARPSEGETWKDKKEEFIDRFEEASNLIFDKTKRGIATFAVVGNNVARVLKQLGKDYFSPVKTDTKPTGPMEIGTLNNQITVIQNPFKSTNSYTVGFRGDQYLYAGFVYCPYIPLFATPTLTTSDLISQKGFLSSAAFKVINAGLFCQGTIANLAGGYVKGT